MILNFTNSTIVNVILYLRAQIIFYQYLPHLLADFGVIWYIILKILLFGERWHRKGLLSFLGIREIALKLVP